MSFLQFELQAFVFLNRLNIKWCIYHLIKLKHLPMTMVYVYICSKHMSTMTAVLKWIYLLKAQIKFHYNQLIGFYVRASHNYLIFYYYL